MTNMRSIVLGVAFLLVFAACSSAPPSTPAPAEGGGASQAPGPAGTQGVKDVEFWYAIGGANGDVVQGLVDQYNSSQDRYVVKATFVPPAERMKMLTVAIASGETPDLFTAGPPDVATLTGSAQLHSMDDLAQRHDTTITKDMFFKPLQDIVVRDGKLWGVPISTGVTGLYYNEDLFAAHGISKAPDTWEELLDAAQRLTDEKKGQWGLLLPTAEIDYTARMWVTFLEQAGGTLLNEDNTKAMFHSEAGVEALQLWVDMFHKYKVAPLKQMDENTTVQTFGAGNVGMFLGYPSWIVQSADFPFTTKTARPIGKERRSAALGGWYLTIPSKGNNPDGAYDFLVWLNQPEHAVEWNLGMGNLPTTQAAVDTQMYQDFLQENPLVVPFNTALAEDAMAPSATGKFGQVLKPVAKAITMAIYQQKTPKEALEDAAAEVDSILAE